MGFSRYVGRVGALAVVLGVGTVVAFPQVALADDGDGPNVGASSQQSPHDSSAAPGAGTHTDAQTHVEPPTVTTTDTSTSTPVTGTPDAGSSPSSPVGTGAPSSTVSAQTNTGSSTSTSGTDEPSSTPTPSPGTTPVPVVKNTTSGPVGTIPTAPATAEATPTKTPAATPPPANDAAPIASAVPSLSRSPLFRSAPDTPTVASVAPRSLRLVAPDVQSNVAGVATVGAQLNVAAAPAPPAVAVDPISALLAIPVAIVSTLVNAVLTPFFGDPATPSQPPLVWAVLGWVRREIEHTFFNSTPVAGAQNAIISLSTPSSVSAPVAFAATDADGDALTYSVPARGTVGGPTHGTVTIDQATGTFTYDPDDAYALTGGMDDFTYTVSDAGSRPSFFGVPLSWGASTATGTVAVTLNRVNRPPTVTDDADVTTEDAPITIAVLTNDTDVDHDPLTVSGVGKAASGTTTFTPAGVTYTPNANFSGTDSFTYTATDGTFTTSGTVTITVTPVDDGPVTVDDAVTVAEDTTKPIDVLANDTDVDGGPKVITGTSKPTNGTVTFTDTALSYTPNANYNGTDTFTYTVNGGSKATVSVTVTPVNDPPMVPSQNITVVQGTTVAFDIFTGASDVEGDAIYVVIGSVQTVQHGVTYHPGSPETAYTYTPNPGFLGQDTYSFRVQNTGADSSSGITTTITFTVIAPPDASPVAVNDVATVAEDSGTTPIFVLANDTDVDAGPKIITAVTQPMNGNVTFTDTAVSYTPNADYNGVDTFTYTLNGGSAASTTVTVTAVNDAPVTKPMFLTLDEDDPGWYFNPFNGATDVDGDVLTLGTVVAPPFGSATPRYSGDRWLIFYKPLKDYAGPDNWSFVVSDGTLTAITTVTITITPVNDAPVAVNDTASVAAGGTTTVALAANDTDVDNPVNPATIVIVDRPTAGTAAVNSNGTVAYTSTGTTTTTDTFTYTITDAAGATSNAATVTVFVTGVAVDAPPVAVNDTATVAEDSGTTPILVLANDTDADGGPKLITAVTQPVNGNVTFTSTGVSYTPKANFNGTDTFTYTLNGGSVAFATVTVTAVNDAPIVGNDVYAVAGNGSLTVDGPGLLANDTDPDGDVLRIVSGTGPRNGTLDRLVSNGAFTYRPNAGYAGTDSFTYTVDDGQATAIGTVTITVSATPNQAPVGVADSYTVDEDTTLTVGAPGVLRNDTDAEGQALSIRTGTGPAHGSLELQSDGSFVYTPGPNFNGTDTFTYRATDGSTDTAATTVTINVTPVNDVPVVASDRIPFPKDGFIGFSLANRSSDADNDKLTGTLITGTQHGTFSFDGTLLSFSYRPNAGFTGEDSFTYKVNDGKVDSAVATITLVVS